MSDSSTVSGVYSATILRHDGTSEQRHWRNFITDEGRSLLARLAGGLVVAPTWYIAAKGSGEAMLDDTYAQRDWPEPTGLSRVAWTPGLSGMGQLSNRANPATLLFTGPCILSGLFIVGAASGSGIVLSVGDWEYTDTFQAGDQIELVYTLSFAPGETGFDDSAVEVINP